MEKIGKPDIYLFTTRINKQLDWYVSWHPETRGNGYQCFLSYLEQQWFLHVLPLSWRLNISDNLQRQGICSDSCTRLVNPHWHLQLLQTTSQDLSYFWLPLRNLTLPHKTSRYHLLCKQKKNKKQTVVNSNQSNYTTENYLHIASIIIILNIGYLILKIHAMY